MKVLVADDDILVRTLLEGLMTGWGYEVVCASDGDEAIAAIQAENGPDLAVVDWMMPKKSGLEVCQLTKSETGRPYLYFILLTSKSGKANIVTGLDAGADDFLSKPVDPEELRSRLAVGSRTVKYENLLMQYATDMERLAREREIFYQVFRHSIQEICVTDVHGYVTNVNPAFLKKYGYAEKEIVGKNLRVLNPGRETYRDLGISEELYDQTFHDLWAAITDPAVGSWEGVVPNQTRNGDIRWVQLAISALREADDKMIGFVGMPVDITDRLNHEFSVRLECYRAITDLAEARDNETGLHLKRVSEFSRLVARAYGMPRKYVEDIATFAPLHDIGKVGIPDNILLAPRRLEDDEYQVMRHHAAIGYEILKDRSTLDMAAEIALTHHERFDGGGYPQGLIGEQIPLCGRIVALVDTYDALRSRRHYKKPWSEEDAVAFIQDESGKHFDPMIVEAFLSVRDEINAVYEANTD